jgi:hypothetical protein
MTMLNLNWKEKRIWNRDDVRSICIQDRYYTRGDCSAYEAMLKYVDNNEPTLDNILIIVDDIFHHSDIDRIMEEGGVSENEVFTSIYFNLVNGAVTNYIELAE